MASNDGCDLYIAGARIQLNDKLAHRWSWRKTYKVNPPAEHVYTRHEIANHYRDFKLKRSLDHQRQRLRKIVPLQMRRGAINEIAVDEYPGKGSVLSPTSLQNSSFNEVYKPSRGRQTLCECEPPDQTYNATSRRIQSAKDLRQFHDLVQQQLGFLQKRIKTNVSTTTTEWQVKGLQTKNYHRQTDFDFLQAACDFYDNRCLSCVNYLQLIGERNRQQKNQSYSTVAPNTIERGLLSIDQPNWQLNDISNTDSPTLRTTDSEAVSTISTGIPINPRLSTILNHVREERSFRIGKFYKNPNWSIKVQITPATAVSAHSSAKLLQYHHPPQHCGTSELHAPRKLLFSSTVKGLACKQLIQSYNHQKENQQYQEQIKGIIKITAISGSMSGTPLCIQTLNLETYRNSKVFQQEQRQQQQQHNSLIEDLQQLHITGENETNLPKITVHDYSTQLAPSGDLPHNNSD